MQPCNIERYLLSNVSFGLKDWYSKQTSCLPKSQSQAWGEENVKKEIKIPHLWIFHHRKDVTRYLNTKLI